MIKLFKKILCVTFIISLTICFTSNIKVNASKITDIDFSESNTVLSSKMVSTRQLDGGVTYNIAKTVAYNNGKVIDNNTNDFTVSWLDSQGTSAIMANWSSTSIVQWTGQKVTSLISDYEKKNPGYLVVGGINGDFFHIQTTCEVMNVCMQEGNLVKPYQWRATGTGVLGWKADGTLVAGEPLNPQHTNFEPSISSNMYLEKLDENNNKVSEKVIASANQAISSTGITLLTEDNSTKSFDLTGFKVIEIRYTMHRSARDGNSKADRLYILGNVTDIKTNLGTNETLPEYSVYLVSKDGSLDDVEIGDKLRMQYHLLGEWADVVNCAGYHDQILKDGVSLFYQSNPSDYAATCCDTAYINCAKNRTIVGSRPDGSTVYMTIEYNQNSTKSKLGASYYECAEYLRMLGCTNGWLLDGGGSTTLAIKDGGSPKLVAGASDKSERPDGNGLFMVIRDPGINVEITEKTHTSLTLHVVENENYGIHQLSNLEISINGTNYKISNAEVGGTYTFDHLTDETEYEVVLSYNLNGEETREQITRHISTSKYKSPSLSCTIDQVSDTACLITPSVYLYQDNTNVSDFKLIINNKEYDVVDNEKILVTGLTPNTEYELTYKVTSIDACNGLTYNYNGSVNETNKVKTNASANPIILSFEIIKLTKDKCTFKYLYYDLGNSVTHAWIDYFGIKEDVEITTEGEYTVEGIDPETDDFIFTLNLEYSGGIIKSSEISTAGVEIKEDVVEKGGCSNNSMIIVLLSIALSTILYIVKKNK